MPCTDVTETIRLVVDGDGRLVGYELRKRTCGQAVGEGGLLAGELAGRRVEDVLAVEAGAVAREGAEDEATFLALKHLFAVQGALRVFIGAEPGRVADGTTLVRVVWEDGAWSVEADIAVDVLVERIRSCGHCRGCGSGA